MTNPISFHGHMRTARLKYGWNRGPIFSTPRQQVFWEVEIPVLGTSPSKQIIFGVLDCMEFHTVVTSNVI